MLEVIEPMCLRQSTAAQLQKSRHHVQGIDGHHEAYRSTVNKPSIAETINACMRGQHQQSVASAAVAAAAIPDIRRPRHAGPQLRQTATNPAPQPARRTSWGALIRRQQPGQPTQELGVCAVVTN